MKNRLMCILTLLLTFACNLAFGQELTCIESDKYPIKICREDESMTEVAETALDFADFAWELYIEKMGFTVPWRINANGEPEQGFEADIVEMTDYAAGMVLPLSDVSETDYSDCADIMLINSKREESYIPFLVEVFFNYAMQRANDCVEPFQDPYTGFLEARFVEDNNILSSMEEYFSWINETYNSVFQKNSFLALDYNNYNDYDLYTYAYGHSLFIMYLDERWGNDDGTLIADISEATRQDGTVIINNNTVSLEEGENEPDLYDAIDTVLKTKDGDFWKAVEEFSVWRVFTGDLADANHLKYGQYISGIEFDTSLMFSDMPVEGQSPENPPQETGTSYINVEIDKTAIGSSDDTLKFELNTDPTGNWYVAAIIFNDDETSTVVETEISTGSGALEIKGLENVNNIIYAVTNLGDKIHDPDEEDWEEGDFTYNITFYNKPTITGIEPAQVVQGAEGVTVTINGSGFREGVEVDFGQGIETDNMIIDTTGEKISLKITVADDAPVGWHEVKVMYAGGLEGVLEQGIEVISGQGPEITAVSPNTGEAGKTINISITGERFKEGITVEFVGEKGITVNRVDYINETSLAVEIKIDEDAIEGARDIKVTNSDGKDFTLTGGFTVTGETETQDEGCSCNVAVNHNESNFSYLAGLFILFSVFIIKLRRNY